MTTVTVNLNCRVCDAPAKIECYSDQEIATRRLSGLYCCDACLEKRRQRRLNFWKPKRTARSPHND